MSDRSRSSAICRAPDDAASLRLVDSFGRVINYLRISLTTACNRRCLYCRPGGTRSARAQLNTLSDDEIVQIVEVAASAGVTTIRFTGGEPLLRHNLSGLVRRVANTPGIDDISMTTNGVLLAGRAHELAEAGLRRVNVSLDTLDATEYRRIAGRNALRRVLQGMDAALAAGLHPVKVNAVFGLSPRWKEDTLNLARLALEQPVYLRFIERMPTGSEPRPHGASAQQLLDTIATVWDLAPAPGPPGNGPARYFRLNGGSGLVGVVAPMSAPFCSTCNRLRLSARGFLRRCLFSQVALDLRPALQRPVVERWGWLRRALELAILAKPRSHGALEDVRAPAMADIGG